MLLQLRLLAMIWTYYASAEYYRRLRQQLTERGGTESDLNPKRGKRASIHTRLKANPSGPAVQSLLLSNVPSLDSKLDELHLLRETGREWKGCCVFAFTEMWLHDNIPGTSIQLEVYIHCAPLSTRTGLLMPR